MEEPSGIDQRLIKMPSQDTAAPRKEIDLATAHEIAQKIVSTSLDAITETTTLAEITGYTQAEVGVAAKILTEDIIDNPDPNTVTWEHPLMRSAKKQTDQGLLTLVDDLDRKDGIGERIVLTLHQGNEKYPVALLLRSSIPAGELQRVGQGFLWGFEDYRNGDDDEIIVTLHDIIEQQKDTTSNEVSRRFNNKFTFKGAQWVFDNLEQWRQNPTTTISPELTIDTLPLPPSSPPPSLLE